jgi:Domain of unknown function (DUF5710)
MTLTTRIDLKVPFVEKDQAKVHGARWDRENQTQYFQVQGFPIRGHNS